MEARPLAVPCETDSGSDDALAPLDTHRPIEVQACVKLRCSPYPALWHIKAEFHEGILTLRGRVSSYYLKQIAQTLAQHVGGVERVVNRIEVGQ